MDDGRYIQITYLFETGRGGMILKEHVIYKYSKADLSWRLVAESRPWAPAPMGRFDTPGRNVGVIKDPCGTYFHDDTSTWKYWKFLPKEEAEKEIFLMKL